MTMEKKTRIIQQNISFYEVKPILLHHHIYKSGIC